MRKIYKKILRITDGLYNRNSPTWISSLEKSDYEPYVLLGQDPEVMLFYPDLLTREESLDHLKGINESLIKTQIGYWAVELKETQEFIGTMGTMEIPFKHFIVSGLEIGWRLHKKFWNQGLATEGALALLDFIETQHIVSEIFSQAAELNKVSIHIMEKIGMEYHSKFIAPDMQKDSPYLSHVLYHKIF